MAKNLKDVVIGVVLLIVLAGFIGVAKTTDSIVNDTITLLVITFLPALYAIKLIVTALK